VEAVCGQSALPPLAPGEAVELKIAIMGVVPGVFNPIFFLSYWAADAPPRYSDVGLKLTVHASPRVEKIFEKTRFRITCPDGYRAIGFRARDFDAERHMIDCDGRTAVFDLVARENVDARFELPGYAVPKAPFAFWFADGGTGFVELPVTLCPLGIAVLLVDRGGGEWLLRVRNISGGVVCDARVSILSPSNGLSYIVSGKSLLVIEALAVGCEAESVFHLVKFEEGVHLQVWVSCGDFTSLNDVEIP
jgi:hypothetical protein